MGENSAIEWTDHTFNPWIGCTKVSPGCDHCYAEHLATNRLGVAWGPHAERRRTADSTWRQPLAWNRKAEREGQRARVFCASLADVFDNQVPAEWRQDLWDLIARTPHLDWLLLTKRPQNIAQMLPGSWGTTYPRGWEHVWLGTTVENQAEAERRIPQLVRVPAKVRFLSCEPLLGPLDLAKACRFPGRDFGAQPLDWIIAGGESGPGARPAHPDWFRSLRDQCAEANVPFFFKRWGDYRAARPVYPEEDRVAATMLAEAAFGPGTDPDAVDIDAVDGITDFMRDFPALGVLYRDGYFYDGVEHQPHVRSGCWWMERVGKKSSGALLDGREHREVPHG